MDFAAKWNVKVVHFSEIRFLGSLEPDNLKKIREYADKLGLDLEVGMRSICPTSLRLRQSAGHRRRAAGENGRHREAAALAACPCGSRQQRRPQRRHRAPHRLDGHGAEELALPRDGCRPQGRDREPRRRHAGARAEDAHRSSGSGVCRRLPRLWQSGVDDRRSPPYARDAGAIRSDEPHARQRAVDRARRRRGSLDTHGRGQHGDGKLHPHLPREVSRQSGLARSDRLEQAAHVQLSRPRILGALQGAAGVGVRALPGAVRARQAVAGRPGDPAITPQARNLADVEASIKWTQAFLASL